MSLSESSLAGANDIETRPRTKSVNISEQALHLAAGAAKLFPHENAPDCGNHHFVASVISRPTHIQGKFCKGIEPLDFRGKKVVNWMADAGLLAHVLSLQPRTAAKGSLTIACASSRIRRR